jgi:hypothetical protein
MSALGQKQTFAPQKVMSALPQKADMCGATRDVRFGPKADSCRSKKIVIRSPRHYCSFSAQLKKPAERAAEIEVGEVHS